MLVVTTAGFSVTDEPEIPLVSFRDAVQIDYCGDALTVAQVATKHGLRGDAIYAMAKKHGWPLRRTATAKVHRPELIKRMFLLLDRQISLMEETMKSIGDKEVAVLGNLARTLEKLIEIEDAQAPKRATKAHSKDMQDIRRKLEKRIDDLTKG